MLAKSVEALHVYELTFMSEPGNTEPSKQSEGLSGMSRKSLIYVGRCLPTNKVYVGSSMQGHRRVFSHTRELDKCRHSNDYLQKAWNKHGADNFVWHVVEECDIADLLTREQWWIEFLRATDERYGFNLCYPDRDEREIFQSELSKSQVEYWRDPIVRGKRLTGLKRMHKDPKWKSRRAEALAARWQDPAFRDKMLGVLKKNTEKLADRMKNEPGFKKHRMRGIQPVK